MPMHLHLESFVPTKFRSLCLLPNPVQLDSLMEGLGAMPIFICTPDNGSVLHFQETKLMLVGLNEVWGLELFLYKFCRPRFSAFIL